MVRFTCRLEELAKHAESCPASQQQKASSNPQEVAPADSRHAPLSSLPPSYAEQQSMTSVSPNMSLTSSRHLWSRDISTRSSPRLPPIQESPVTSPRGDGSNVLWEEHNEDMDNVVIDHRTIAQDINGRDRIPPDGGSVITETPYKSRPSSSRPSKSSKSPKKASSLTGRKTPKSKRKSSKHHSDADSVGTSVSKASRGSKYSTDPMSDFRLKLLFDSPNENQQEAAGQSSERSKVDQHEVAGSSSERLKGSKKNQHSSSSSSSSSSSNESPRKVDKKDTSRKVKVDTNVNQSQINMLEERMSQLEQTSVETNNTLQRIEQLLQLVVQSKTATDQ